MSNKNGVAALGGLITATTLGLLVVGAVGWFGTSYYYGEQRVAVREKVLAFEFDAPMRVDREDAVADCDAGNMRAEAESRLSDVSAFEVSKIAGFDRSPSASRARGLSSPVRNMKPAITAFLGAYACARDGRFERDGTELQLSGVALANGVAVATWLDPDRMPDLVKVLWIGRDIQSSGGLYEFIEGSRVMRVAIRGLASHLPEGELDVQLDQIAQTLARLDAAPGSAQPHWQGGAQDLLADLLGPEWDDNPPTPMRARAMMDNMDSVLMSLDQMPDVGSRPYVERRDAMLQWIETDNLSKADSRFSGFGGLGLKADLETTRTRSELRALLIGTALRSYHKRRRYCPASLDELVDSTLLTEVPTDPLTGSPYDYDRNRCAVTVPEPVPAADGRKPQLSGSEGFTVRAIPTR